MAALSHLTPTPLLGSLCLRELEAIAELRGVAVNPLLAFNVLGPGNR